MFLPTSSAPRASVRADGAGCFASGNDEPGGRTKVDDPGDDSQQVAEGIDEVDAGFVDQQLRVVAKERQRHCPGAEDVAQGYGGRPRTGVPRAAAARDNRETRAATPRPTPRPTNPESGTRSASAIASRSRQAAGRRWPLPPAILKRARRWPARALPPATSCRWRACSPERRRPPPHRTGSESPPARPGSRLLRSAQLTNALQAVTTTARARRVPNRSATSLREFAPTRTPRQTR